MKNFPNKVGLAKKWSIILFLLYIYIFYAHGEDSVTVRGFLDETTLNGKFAQQSSNEFQAVISDDGKWTFQVTPIHKTNDVLYGKKDVTYMTFDGGDVYFCQYTEAVEGLTNGRPGIVGTRPISDQAQLAYISTGNYPFSPFDNDWKAQILWLAYGAGKYIHDSKTETMPLPWRPARLSLRSYGFRLQSLLSTNPPFIPIAIQFIRDSKLDLQGEESEYERPELDQPVDQGMLEFYQKDLIARKDRWRDGDVAGTLTTSVYTNVAGISLPLSFEIKIYLTPKILFRQYNGNVANLEAKNSTELTNKAFQPSILSKLIVTDSRFRFRDARRQIDNIQYDLTPDEQWMPTNSETLQKEFGYYLATPSSLRHKFSIWPESVKRDVVLGVMLVSTIVPLLLIFKFLHHSAKQKKQK